MSEADWKLADLEEGIRWRIKFFKERAAFYRTGREGFDRGVASGFEIAAESFEMLLPPAAPALPAPDPDPDAILKERARDAVIESIAVDVVSGRQEE